MVTVLAAVILTVLGQPSPFSQRCHLPRTARRVDRVATIGVPELRARGAVEGHSAVSWLVLRGRCRDCQWPIPRRYVLVEVANAAVCARDLAVSTNSPGSCCGYSSLPAHAYLDDHRPRTLPTS